MQMGDSGKRQNIYLLNIQKYNMELDAVENLNSREKLEQAVERLSASGICRAWAIDLVMMVYLVGLREEE